MNRDGKRRIPRFLTGALAFLLGAGFPAWAEDTADDDKRKGDAPAAERPVVVTVEESAPYIPSSNTIATRLPVDLIDTPANVGTVNEPLLRDQANHFLGEALHNVSGVNSQTQSGVADFFLIRGVDSLSSGLVLTDGAAEPEVSFFHMYNVERVEVLKGPGGFLYGRTGLTGALGGVVNIVRRQPVPGSFTRAGLSGGSFGTYQANVDWNVADSDAEFGFRLNTMYRQSDFYRDDKENDTFAVNPAFTWWLSPDTALNVNVEYVDSSFEPDSGVPLFNGEIADVDRETSYQSPFDFSDQQISRVQVDFETRLSDRWRLRNKTFYRELDWESNGTLLVGVNALDPFTFMPIPPEVLRSMTILDDDQRFVGNQSEAIWSHTAGGVEHNLLAGFEVAVYADEFRLDLGCDPTILGTFGQCTLPSVGLADPVETATDFVTIPFDAGDSRTLVTAPYATYQGRFTDWFQVMAGLRLDRVDFEDDLTGEQFDDTDVSPTLGVVFQPSADVSIYASAAESFAPPSVRVSDPEPEEGRQIEVGVKQDYLDGKLLINVAAYRLQRDNIPIPDENGFTQQSGDQESRGLELEIAAEPMPGLRTFFSYAYTDAELESFSEQVVVGVDPITFQPIFGTVDRSGNTPAFVPDHMANLWVTQRYDSGFGWGGGLRYVDDQFISEDNAFRIDSYLLGDVALYYRVGRWDLQLNVKNVTDEEYETRGFGSTSVIPGDERSVLAGFEVRF